MPTDDQSDEEDDDEDDDLAADQVQAQPPARRASQASARAQQEKSLGQTFYRTGTQERPYQRADGQKTQKLTFTAPWGLKRELERFCLDMDLPRSEWISSVLRKEMAKARRRAERAKPNT